MSCRAGENLTSLMLTAGVVLCAWCGAGCARPRGELFAPLATPWVWPTPPEMPRIRYVGSLSSSEDLRAERSGSESFKAALRGPRQPIRFVSPNGVARGSGSWLAVTDTSVPGVHLINLEARTHTLVSGWDDQRFQAPLGVTFVEDRLIVADAARGELIELTPDGAVRRVFGGDLLQRPVGVAWMASRGELLVVDSGTDELAVFDDDGRLLRKIGGPGTEPGRFNRPSHVAVHNEMILIADSAGFRVQLLNPDGNVLGVFGRKGDGAGDFALPKGVAFDRAGHVYVVDAQFENVQIFDRQGRLLLAFGEEGTGIGEFSLPAGLAIDESDRIWIADSGNRRVQVFDFVGGAS